MLRSVRSLLGAVVFGVSLLGLCSQAQAAGYLDPGDPGTTIMFSGSALLVPVPGIGTGNVYVDYWAFQYTSDPGFYYAYRLRNVSGGNVTGTPARLTYFDIVGIAPFADLGDGGGMGAGSTYVAWSFLGDGTVGDAYWQGSAASSYIRQGTSSPNPPETAKMYEIYSSYAPGVGPLYESTVSGGGYTGQTIDVYVPVVPEPATVAGLVTGLLSLGAIARRRRK